IHFEPALQLPAIVFSEWTGKRPFVLRRVGSLVLLGERRHGKYSKAGEDQRGAGKCHGFPQAFTGGGAGAPIGTPSPSTDSVIEFGTGLVRSTLPSTGRMIRK